MLDPPAFLFGGAGCHLTVTPPASVGRFGGPVRAQLAEFSSTIWDFRGHGRSLSARDRCSWWEMADDVLGVREALPQTGSRTRVVGVGHSMGGTALVMAELRAPGSFEALVLVEPILFGPPYRPATDHPLVGLALRRRASFDSRAVREASYASKPPSRPGTPMRWPGTSMADSAR